MREVYYANIVDEPRYDKVDETNEDFFYVEIKTINQNNMKIALSSSADNNYEKYKLNEPIKVIVDNEYKNYKIVKEVKFISKQDIINEAINEYRQEKLSMTDYINVVKDNCQNLKREFEYDEEIEYSKEISRLVRNKYKAKGQIIKGYTEEEVYEIIKDYLKSSLIENEINTDIIDFQIIGSRNKGTSTEKSDLDVLVEYNNSNLGEDSLFNLFNSEENQLNIDGIRVDVNPITKEKSGTISEWLERNYNYDKYKENMKEYASYIIESLKEKFQDQISYVYKITFFKDEKNHRYSVSLAIDIDNDGNKNQINFISADKFYKMDRNEQMKYMGNFYNASIRGKRKEEFGYDEAKKDFLLMCDFNYTRDNEEDEETT